MVYVSFVYFLISIGKLYTLIQIVWFNALFVNIDVSNKLIYILFIYYDMLHGFLYYKETSVKFNVSTAIIHRPQRAEEAKVDEKKKTGRIIFIR